MKTKITLKSTFFLALVLIAVSANSQNTFPANGNIGIGTTSPGYPLHVVGAINSEVTGTGATSNTSYVTFSAYNPLNGYPKGQFLVGQTSDDVNVALVVSALNTSPGVYKPACIGVTTNKDILDPGTFSTYLTQELSVSSWLSLTKDGQAAGGTPMVIKPGNIEAVRFLVNGNVGIGTSSPDQKLQVEGNILATGNVMIGAGIDYSKVSSYALAVNGTAIANKIIVKAYPTWPDYVFKKEFKLPSLEEIESYIKINHHLPEIPSASEVEKNGIDLGDNQVMLLKKIEELTLFAIEQNKQTEKLQKIVDEQSNKIEEQSTRILELEMNFKTFKPDTNK